MKADCVRMSLKRAETFVDKVTDEGKRQCELVDKLEKTTTRAVIRMAKMTVEEIDQLCGSLIYVAECKELTVGERRTFAKLHDHAFKYVGTRKAPCEVVDIKPKPQKPKVVRRAAK